MFDPARILRTLNERQVAYLVIGGVASRVHGSPTLTGDLDICYERSTPNLEALAAALRQLQARLRGPGIPPDLPFQLDAMTLNMGDHFTFTTDAGDLDCLGIPAGTTGYDDLIRGAVTVLLDDQLSVMAAAIEDLIRMKRAANRPKDRVELEILSALREEIERKSP